MFSSWFEKRKWKVGPPSKDGTKVGALISEAHMNKVKGYIELARKEGATICCGEGVDSLDLPAENNKVNKYLLFLRYKLKV